MVGGGEGEGVAMHSGFGVEGVGSRVGQERGEEELECITCA